jgi:aryl-alcohol dehydrogenase-like predicted oxidoreductase
VTLIAYTPLAGGLLSGKYSTENRPRGFFRRVLPRYRRQALEALQPVVQLLTEIGDRHARTPAQVALRWLIENPVVLPIPGAKNGRQAAANVGALEFSMSADEVEALNQATLARRG